MGDWMDIYERPKGYTGEEEVVIRLYDDRELFETFEYFPVQLKNGGLCGAIGILPTKAQILTAFVDKYGGIIKLGVLKRIFPLLKNEPECLKRIIKSAKTKEEFYILVGVS